MADVARLRQELEEAALAGDGFAVILRNLSTVANRICRLVAVHGGLLASSEDEHEGAAASVPVSGLPASASLERGVDPETVRFVLGRAEATAVTCTDGMPATVLAVRALVTRRVGLLLMEEPVGAAGV